MEFEFARNKQVSKQAFGVKGFLESRLRREDTFPGADGFGLAPSTPLSVAR